jgi:hypothetical protein
MSRTYRNYIDYFRNHYTFDKTQLGINPDYVTDSDKEVEQNRLINGYDGVNLQHYYDSFGKGGWRENYQGDTRKFFKRRYHKGSRRYSKNLVEEELNMM